MIWCAPSYAWVGPAVCECAGTFMRPGTNLDLVRTISRTAAQVRAPMCLQVFFETNSVPRVVEVIDTTDSEGGGGGPSKRGVRCRHPHMPHACIRAAVRDMQHDEMWAEPQTCACISQSGCCLLQHFQISRTPANMMGTQVHLGVAMWTCTAAHVASAHNGSNPNSWALSDSH